MTLRVGATVWVLPKPGGPLAPVPMVAREVCTENGHRQAKGLGPDGVIWYVPAFDNEPAAKLAMAARLRSQVEHSARKMREWWTVAATLDGSGCRCPALDALEEAIAEEATR